MLHSDVQCRAASNGANPHDIAGMCGRVLNNGDLLDQANSFGRLDVAERAMCRIKDALADLSRTVRYEYQVSDVLDPVG